MRGRPLITLPRLIGVAAAVAVTAVAWLLRPLLHGPLLFFWTAPIVWVPPVLVLLAGLLRARSRGVLSADELRAGRPSPVLIAAPIVAFALFVAGSVLIGPVTDRALYNATTYEEIPELPASGTVRLIPREVAEQIASSGFNSPTERLTDFHVVRTDDGLEWTALRTPNGLVRTYTKKSQGIVALDAQNTARDLRQVDAELEVAPGLQVTDNLRWRLRKRKLLVQLGEVVGIEGPDGEPLIAVPYTDHEGLIIRRPVFGGVFVVHPDGRIEDLSPAQARRRPELVRSGRVFPEVLARRIQDAYAYKEGVINRFFIHEEQTQITDTEANRQPYLIDFGARGTQWVTVAEPFGRASAASAVFLTDTITGATQIWRVPEGTSLTGNRRALQTVRSLTIPGVVFADQDGAAPGQGGAFRAIEPRPVFVRGRLVYLVAIVPESANSVSKTVVIDAARNEQVAIFDNDSDPEAEAKTLRYVRTGIVPGDAAVDAGDEAAPAGEEQGADEDAASAGDEEPAEARPDDPDAPAGDASPQEAERELDALIERQRELLEDFEALRERLR